MAPDRGVPPTYQAIRPHGSPSRELLDSELDTPSEAGDVAPPPPPSASRARSATRRYLAAHAEEGQNFTVRGVVVGLCIGVIICFSNMYFGLQTGWISGMAMPSALIGFAFFKTVSNHINFPFTPVENVLVQTVAGALGTMPLGCGFVGVIPALNYMLKPEENGPLQLGVGKLMLWSFGICLFGVFLAVPLRRQVIIREKLKFPSGTATALMIEVLHGGKDAGMKGAPLRRLSEAEGIQSTPRLAGGDIRTDVVPTPFPEAATPEEANIELDERSSWKSKIRLLIVSFTISAVYTLASYFLPQLRDIPILGLPLANNWLWTLNPSPAYVGQGLIMGPATTLHMLLGAIIGWGILSPLAKAQGWAPGPVGDWEKGSKGWIVWVSLAIMLADSIVSLGWLALRPIIQHGPEYLSDFSDTIHSGHWKRILNPGKLRKGYTAITGAEPPASLRRSISPPRVSTASEQSSFAPEGDKDAVDIDAPPEHLVSNQIVIIGLVVSLVICVGCIQISFGEVVPVFATIIAVLLALLLSVMGVRALGETDLNPVSGISKLTQLFFALIIPRSNQNSVIINLVAGAISESGALQAGDMMQDLKTGHLLGAAPKAQFYGQIIGSIVGAFVSAAVYQLYTNVYKIPGGLFQVPTGYVWIFTARLVTGQGLPAMAWQWALGAGVVFCITTSLRVAGQGKNWQSFIPGGIAVAVGMYNVPSFTLARTIGGLINWYWRVYRRREESPIVILASGLILGEGVLSIANLVLASFDVPHL